MEHEPTIVSLRTLFTSQFQTSTQLKTAPFAEFHKLRKLKFNRLDVCVSEDAADRTGTLSTSRLANSMGAEEKGFSLGCSTCWLQTICGGTQPSSLKNARALYQLSRVVAFLK
ncbi:hypothetical protein CEXT_711121 [Caerostris extrusa]|uniref:Uncharacterized protein n=1 Tax=Caerostris extrusa TaxID=172846 RepID=A0AAV4R6A1_CAEEX|nr:hypothetical protein CEXT_711121 [Caerostris extrusa]